MFKHTGISTLTSTFLPSPARTVLITINLIQRLFTRLSCHSIIKDSLFIFSFAMDEYTIVTLPTRSINKVYARLVYFCQEVSLLQWRYFGKTLSYCVSIYATITLVAITLLPIKTYQFGRCLFETVLVKKSVSVRTFFRFATSSSSVIALSTFFGMDSLW